jgi:hypothetical protein
MSQMFLNVVSTFKGDGLSAATRQLGAFGKQANGLGGTLGKVGAALASFGLAAKAVTFTQKTIDEAKNLQQNLFALDLIFGKLSPEMENFAKNASRIGLSQAEAAKASVFLGSVMKQSGFGIEDVADKTQTLVSLASDLALVYQYDVQEALLGMTALFRGEYDPIEKFGVAMKQSEINAVLVAKKLNHLTGEQRRLAEQTIRYDLFLQRATDSMGAFENSSGNLAAESLKLSAEFKNMQSVVGTALVPSITDLVVALKPLVEQLTPRLVQIVTDAQPAIQVFNQLIKDMGDNSTTTGQTVTVFADIFGTTFRLFAENFGVLLQLTTLFLGVRTAIYLVTTALSVLRAHPVISALTLIAAGVILVNDGMKNLKYTVDTTGKSVTTFKTALKDSGKESDYVNKKYGVIGVTFQEATAEAQRLGEEVANADKAKLDNLKAQVLGIRISAGEAANELRRMMTQAGIKVPDAPGATGASGGSTTTTGGGKPAAAALSAIEQLNKTQSLSVKQAEAQGKLLGVGLEQGVVDQILSMAKPVKSANDIFKDLTKKNGELTKKGVQTVQKYNATFNAGIEQVNARRAEAAQAAEAAAQAARQAAEELRRAEEARIEGLNQLYANFLDTIKGTFAGIKTAIQGAFDITGLGGSTNAILRNMDKLLNKLKSFSTNVKQLATMGLDPALLQQIITAGPMAGARIASALVAGGAGALSAINAGYGQVGNLASEIATTGVNSLFDTQRQQSVYNITVTGGVGSGSTIGKAIVDAIKDYERTSGAVWQGA